MAPFGSPEKEGARAAGREAAAYSRSLSRCRTNCSAASACGRSRGAAREHDRIDHWGRCRYATASTAQDGRSYETVGTRDLQIIAEGKSGPDTCSVAAARGRDPLELEQRGRSYSCSYNEIDLVNRRAGRRQRARARIVDSLPLLGGCLAPTDLNGLQSPEPLCSLRLLVGERLFAAARRPRSAWREAANSASLDCRGARRVVRPSKKT